MKTKLLLIATAAMFFGWSCSKDNGTQAPNTPIEVKTPEAAQNALNNGSNDITISTPLTSDVSLVIPNGFPEGSTVTLNIPANGNDITISENNSRSQSFPKINLNATEVQSLTILTPNSSVIFSGSAETITASTAPTTLTITKGTSVESLVSLQGSVKIFGTVGHVTNTGSGKILLGIGSGSDRPVVQDIIKTTLTYDWINGIILTEGKYPLNPDIKATGSEFGQNNAAFSWYLPIEKDGFQIIGEGDVQNIILYGETQQANGIWSSQNLITVFASNVTISGITLKNKLDGNKMIEVTKPGFTVSNCRFVPNDEVTPEEGYEAFVGGVYFSQNADSGLVENNFFKTGTVSVDGLLSGTFNVNNNTFDSVYGGNFVVISTPDWSTPDVSSSTMKLNLTGNRFVNVPVYDGVNITLPVLSVKYGTVTLNGNTFPSNGVYYKVTGSGKLILDNGQTVTPAN